MDQEDKTLVHWYMGITKYMAGMTWSHGVMESWIDMESWSHGVATRRAGNANSLISVVTLEREATSAEKPHGQRGKMG